MNAFLKRPNRVQKYTLTPFQLYTLLEHDTKNNFLFFEIFKDGKLYIIESARVMPLGRILSVSFSIPDEFHPVNPFYPTHGRTSVRHTQLTIRRQKEFLHCTLIERLTVNIRPTCWLCVLILNTLLAKINEDHNT